MKTIKNHLRRAQWQSVGLFYFAILLAQVFVPVLLTHASAGTLDSGMVRFDRMNASQATTGTVCATTNSASQTEAAVAVTFPTGYTVSTTTGNWAVSTATTTGWPTGAAAWPGITAPSSANQISGQTVQFTSTNLTASTLYCFNWTSSAALSIKSSATSSNTGTIITCSNATDCAGTGSGGTSSGNLDTSSYATASVANTCGSGAQACDQIQVSASVNASFSFSLSATTAALSTLSTSAPSESSAINASVSTNAAHGWQMWAADLSGTPGLRSTTASKTISYNPAAGSGPATLSAGNEGYNVGAGTASGTTCTSVTTDPNFASGGTQYRGGGLDGTLRSLAASTGVANACALPLKVNASISATTPAATDYASTVTVVAAGSF
jgi:hypothetical protein